jgi:hypothetical protein
MKRKTEGVDLKLPIQALVTIITFVLSYFGIDLSPELSAAISILLGAIAAYFGPAARTALYPEKKE